MRNRSVTSQPQVFDKISKVMSWDAKLTYHAFSTPNNCWKQPSQVCDVQTIKDSSYFNTNLSMFYDDKPQYVHTTLCCRPSCDCGSTLWVVCVQHVLFQFVKVQYFDTESCCVDFFIKSNTSRYALTLFALKCALHLTLDVAAVPGVRYNSFQLELKSWQLAVSGKAILRCNQIQHLDFLK